MCTFSAYPLQIYLQQFKKFVFDFVEAIVFACQSAHPMDLYVGIESFVLSETLKSVS